MSVMGKQEAVGRATFDRASRMHLIEYTPNEPYPTEPYITLSVKLEGTDVANSPMHQQLSFGDVVGGFHLMPPAELTVALDCSISISTAPIVLTTVDGTVQLSFKKRGSTIVGTVSAALDTDTNNLCITVSAPHVGEYELSIIIFGEALHGSPFSMTAKYE